MKPKQRFTLLTITATMVAGLTSAGTGAAAVAAVPAAAGKTTVSSTVSSTARLSADVARTVHGSEIAARQKALAAYWTPTRMKTARPDAELPSVKAAATAMPATAQARTVTAPQGAPQRIAAAAPKVQPKPVRPGVSTEAYMPGYPVGHPVARTVGKVFFTSFGKNYVCSAAVVNSEGKSEVWTAGHCVSDGQAWNTDWTFVPNYYSGVAPYGYWYASSLTTTKAWFNNNKDWANDVGAAVMNRNSDKRIADQLGGQGIAWNQTVSGYQVYAFGYPHASPFNGCCLYAERNYTYDGGNGTIYMVNNMTGGSSGGPWLNPFDGQWGSINGHNDFKYNATPQYMYSPYYGNQVADVYNAVRYTSA